MKKLLLFINIFNILTLLLPYQSFSISDKEYNQFINASQDFANTDKNLMQIWKQLKQTLPQEQYQNLLKEQKNWLKNRDNLANQLINKGNSRINAYTIITKNRIAELQNKYFNNQNTSNYNNQNNNNNTNTQQVPLTKVDNNKYVGKIVERSYNTALLDDDNNEILIMLGFGDKFPDYLKKCKEAQSLGYKVEVIGIVDYNKKLIIDENTQCKPIQQETKEKKLIGPKIFGLQLGMPISEAYSLLQNKYGNNKINKSTSDEYYIEEGISFAEIGSYASSDKDIVYPGEEPIKDNLIGFLGITNNLLKVDNLLNENTFKKIVKHYNLDITDLKCRKQHSIDICESKNNEYKLEITPTYMIIQKLHKSKPKEVKDNPVFE